MAKMMRINKESMREEVLRLCRERAMTVNELAALIPGLNRSTLRSIAIGRWESVALSTGRIIAESLGLKLELEESKIENEYFVRFIKEEQAQNAYGEPRPDDLKHELKELLKLPSDQALERLFLLADKKALEELREILIVAQGMRHESRKRKNPTAAVEK